MNQSIPSYPLHWPEGWPRSSYRQDAKFRDGKGRVGATEGARRVLHELSLMGVKEANMIISSNVEVRLGGSMLETPKNNDPGVAVYWPTKKGENKVMAIDRYSRVADNLAAIAATLEALRGIERWGGGAILERAFSGFTALPAPGKTLARGWREVLGVTPTELSIEVVREKYRRLSSVHHPDKGGTEAAMSELNWAWAQAQEALRA